MSRLRDMKRWTDAKLEKELYFAGPANDGSPECAAWNAALVAECLRRGQTPPINLSPNWKGKQIRDPAYERSRGWKR